MSYYFEGFDGFARCDQCPYKYGTFARVLWLRGWDDAAAFCDKGIL
jgi:ribosome modulation factor